MGFYSNLTIQKEDGKLKSMDKEGKDGFAQDESPASA